MISARCPGCGRHYQLSSQAAGKKVRCKQPDCGTIFPVPQSSKFPNAQYDGSDRQSAKEKFSRKSARQGKQASSSLRTKTLVQLMAATVSFLGLIWLLGHFVFQPGQGGDLAVTPEISRTQASAQPDSPKAPDSPLSLATETVPQEFLKDETPPVSPPAASTPPPAEEAPSVPTPLESVPPPTPSNPPLPKITIDGDFSDWKNITSYVDPPGDTHDVNTRGRESKPKPVENPDADLLEYKVMHDAENLYAYFRARGQIGRTQKETEAHKRNIRQLELSKNGGRGSAISESRRKELEQTGQPGRYYAILTIDVDQDDSTGYWLDEGGYYPSTRGYDVNAELEWFDAQINTGHYLNHGARDESELLAAFLEQTQGKYVKDNDGPYPAGTLTVKPGTYKFYTQWVYHENDTITIVRDKGPAIPGIVRFALSKDRHEVEAQFPYKGFLKDPSGNPTVALGRTLDISFSLEASGEFTQSHEWSSDTGDPIEKYTLTPPP